uniref:Receptor-like serine/threonine-protein kinase n=1 Tax=Pohlia nutans TaxID=140635 RepID=A0A125SL75_9BRYO|nr:G-type lectin-domain containing receptor kinase 4 [Pohlia nutans]
MELCRNILWVLLPLVLTVTKAMAQTQSGASFTVGASLGTNQTWLSENGTFTMGYTPIPANSTSLYLGVWYSGVQVVPVWLMHRERPVKAGATLTLTRGGNLVLVDADGSQVFTSNTSALGVVGGQFLENGNIVLQNGSDATVWDSFNYPTDTFLPGLVVQVGHKFTSWKSNDDPSPGLYTFGIMANGELHFMWNNSQLYYSSGPWAGSYYTNPPQLGRTTPPDVFHYDNSTGSPRIWYTTSGRSVTADITLKRMRLDPDGVARQHIWVIDTVSWQTFISAPMEPCDAYRVCGQNSLCTSSNYIPGCSCLPDHQPVSASEWNDQDYWLHGCSRDPQILQCTNGSSPDATTSFLALADATTLEGDQQTQIYFNETESSCREKCVQNCSCSGYSFMTGITAIPNCTLHSASTVVYNARTSNDSVTTPFMLRFQAIPSPIVGDSKGSSFTGTKLIVTVVVLVSFLILVLVAALLWWRFRMHKRGGEGSLKDFSAVGVVRFSYKELVDATGNFSKQLGGGGFGPVHKGTLGDKSEVAVKTLQKLKQGEQEFRTEVAVIGTVQHINIVRLRGFCAEGDHRALVYEFIPNGSLEKYLFTKSDEKEQVQEVLDWKTRMTIALGTARGLAYLHHECRSAIIHCDIKPENILLTADFTPKVSDLGLAKLLGKDVSRVITMIRGTRGYLAPEWLTNCTLTSKVDVYSFGMTLLELISGRRTVDLSQPSEKYFYAVWVYKEMVRGEPLTTLVDERLTKGSVEEDELRRALQVGLWCAQDDPDKRPSMRDVVKMLEGTLDIPDAPVPPSYAQTSDEGFHSGHAAVFNTTDLSDQDGSSQMNKISFEYTQTFSAR